MKHSKTGEKKLKPLAKPRIPIDKGWAWMIMIGVYLNGMLCLIFPRAMTILLPLILDRYHAPAAATTLAFGIGDISWAITNLIIPTLLLPRFSVRSLALVGSVMHCVGLISVAYAPNIIIFNSLFAVFGSAGGIIIVPSLIHVGHFFKKRLSFASSFIHAGGSTAGVFAPFLIQKLVDKYGFQGSLLIITAISMNCLAASMLLRPLSMYDNEIEEHVTADIEFSNMENAKSDKEFNESSTFLKEQSSLKVPLKNIIPPNDYNTMDVILEKGPTNNMDDTNHVNTNCELSDLQKCTNKNETKNLSDDLLLPPSSLVEDTPVRQGVCTTKNNYKDSDDTNTSEMSSFCDNLDSDETLQQNHVNNKHTDLKKCMPSANTTSSYEQTYKFDTNHDTSVQEQEIHKPIQLFDRTDSTNDKPYSPQNNHDGYASDSCCSIQRIKNYFVNSVLVNPVAVMLIIAGGLSTPGGAMYFSVLSLENGLTTEEVPWIITIIGVADIVGRLAIGYFTDLGYFRPIRIVCLAQLTVGSMCQFTMFYKGFAAMATMAAVYGLTAGTLQSLFTPMIIEMVGLEYLAQMTPVYFLTLGISTFILNISVGAIRDATGSFIGGYNFLGGLILLSFFILLLEPVFIRCRDSKKSNGYHAGRSKLTNSSI